MSTNTIKKTHTTVVMSGRISFFWASLFFVIGLATGLAYQSPPRISFHEVVDGGVK